jgi:hypothetical protein
VEPSPEVLQAEASLQEIMDAIRARMTAPAEAIEDVDAREAAALAETDRLLADATDAVVYPHADRTVYG